MSPACNRKLTIPLRSRLAICLALVVTTLAVYWPVTHFEFVNLDDPDYVTANPWVARGLTWPGLLWAFQTSHAANWHPLTWLSHMLDVQLFGLPAGPHHLVNLLFHLANTVLLFLFFRSMTGALWRSALVAALFALHPLHVESVAWVAERKDVLSTFFGLLSLWAYACYAANSKSQRPTPKAQSPKAEVRSPKSKIAGGAAATRNTQHVSRFTFHAPSCYLLSLLLFALSLMSKPMLVTLPFLLLLLDYWPLQRLELNPQNSTLKTLLSLVREKAPFFVLSALSSAITLFTQGRGGTVASLENTPIIQRLAGATLAYVTYLGKAVWPRPLAMFYPFGRDWGWGVVVCAGLFLLALSVAAVLFARRRPWLCVGWFWFLGTLVPVIGLVQAGAQATADRYTYLPLVGLFIALAWGMPELLPPWRYRPAALSALAAGSVFACMTATSLQLPHWQNTEALCRHALRVTRGNYLAHGILGSTLLNQGRAEAAEAQFTLALQISPGFSLALSGLGKALLQEGKATEAAALFNQTLELFPQHAVAHYLLAGLLVRQNQLDEATRHFEEALRSNPALFEAHYELAHLLVARGNPQAGLPHALAALRLAPDAPAAHFSVGSALLAQGKPQDALPHFQAALTSSPDFAEARLACAQALLRLGKLEEAKGYLRDTLRAQPDNIEGHRLLAEVYSAQKRAGELREEYTQMVRLAPNWPEALNNLAWLLATHPSPELRDGPQAVSLAQRACTLTGRTNLWLLATLAGAYAEAGNFPEAVATQETVCRLAAAQGQGVPAESFQRRLELYRSGQPCREP